MKFHHFSSLFFLLSLFSSVACAQSNIILFQDTFDRGNTNPANSQGFGVDLTETNVGQSGILAPLDIAAFTVDVGSLAVDSPDGVFGQTGSNIGIFGTQLVIEAGNTNGNSGGVAFLNHNFIDPEILAAGEFTVSLDIAGATSAGQTRRIGFGIGQSLADISNNLASADVAITGVSDLFVAFDNVGTDQGIDVAQNGSIVIDDAGPLSIPSIPATLSTRFFNITDFNAGSSFSYEVFLDGNSVATGTSVFSGTNENYFVISSQFSNEVFLDNFVVSTVSVAPAAQNVLLFTFDDSGPNVTATVTGFFDTSGLNFFQQTPPNPPGAFPFAASTGFFLGTTTAANVDQFVGASAPGPDAFSPPFLFNDFNPGTIVTPLSEYLEINAAIFDEGSFIALAEGETSFNADALANNVLVFGATDLDDLGSSSFLSSTPTTVFSDPDGGNIIQFVAVPILGDVNQDGVVDFFDISPFLEVLANESFLPEADINRDGIVDFFDIAPFIAILTGN